MVSDAAERPPHARITGDVSGLATVLAGLGVPRGRPVLVVVGGADGMSPADEAAFVRLVADHLVPRILAAGAVVVDGGTNSGIMRVLGGAREAAGHGFPLVGVAVAAKVVTPENPADGDDRTELEPRHSAVLLTPGSDWGDESRWLAEVGTTVADGAPSATLVVNGGEATYGDVSASLDAGRPVLVVAGTGRTADTLAAAAAGRGGEARDVEIVRSPLVRVVRLDDPEGTAALAGRLLSD